MKRLPKHRYPRKISNFSNISREKEDENSNFFQRNKIDLTIILTSVPAICYLFVYFYQFSLFGYYNIPSELISIDLKNVVWFLFIFIAGICLLTCISFFLSSSSKFKVIYTDSKKGIIFPSLLFLIGLIIASLHFLDSNNVLIFNKEIKFSKETYIISFVLLFLFTIVVYITKIRWRVQQKKAMTISDKIAHTAMISISLILIAMYMGRYIPYFSTSHYVIKGDKDTYYVLLSTYKDKFIVSPVDLNKKVITPEFSFIKIETDNPGNAQVQTVKTGRLTVKEPTTSKELTNLK